MYQYPMPPWWGYPTPQTPPSNDLLERGVKLAMRLAQREEREKERKKEREKRERESFKKEAQQARYRFMTGLELFTLGVILYPVIAPLYNHVIKMAGG